MSMGTRSARAGEVGLVGCEGRPRIAEPCSVRAARGSACRPIYALAPRRLALRRLALRRLALRRRAPAGSRLSSASG